AEGHTLAELAPAPKYAALWKREPRALVDLLIQARCRPVRSWAIQMIRADLPAVLLVFTLEERLGLLAHDDEEVVALIADLLREDPGLKNVPLARWLSLVETASAASLDLLCELMRRNVDAGGVPLGDALRLATARPIPVARLGLEWLRASRTTF